MKRRMLILGGVLLVSAVGVSLTGCGQSAPSTTATSHQPMSEKNVAKPTGDDAHGHKPGAHGGILVSLGQDSYHAEAVFEKGGLVRLHMLGKEETRVQEVDVQELIAYLTEAGVTESDKMTFRAEPQPGDTKGKTSLFVANLPKDLVGKKVQVTVNNINVNGERFRIAFSNETKDEHGGGEMPAKKGSDEEQTLFLTPGGAYTAADIVANGKTVPTVKYKGVRAQHDDNPKPGEKICPISKTKANPKFSWVIGGKIYEFCCIPCIEEFVVLAKEKPTEIKDPETYRKK